MEAAAWRLVRERDRERLKQMTFYCFTHDCLREYLSLIHIYIAIITGDLSAVKAAVDTAVTTYEDKCIDSFVLGNPHESIFPAIYGTTQVEEILSLIHI